MGRGLFSRPVAAALLTASTAFAVSVLSAPAEAQTAAAASGGCPYWADPATGKRIDRPLVPDGSRLDPLDPNHAHTPNGPTVRGRTYVRGPDGTWFDPATGQQIDRPLVPDGSRLDPLDPHHAHTPNGPTVRGRTYVLIPCPPPQTSASTGLYLGGELVKNWGWVRSTERLAATDVVTNQFSDRADPFGGGVIVGYKFAPWANNVVVSPFASFDFMHAPVNHSFAGGSYLGTTANFMGTFGLKVGPQFDAFWLYGIAGVSALNETLNINFIPVSSSQSAWVAGGTIGVGGAWQPAFLQGYGHPVSLFAEYQHTWWQDANFNTPAASPLFNYNFARQDYVVKFGFTVSLSAPPSAPAPIYPVKALPVK